MATSKLHPTGSYRFRIIRDGFEVEAEGDRQFVLDVMARYADGAELRSKGVGTKSAPPKAVPATGDKGMSVREFIRSFDIKKHTDFLLAFGYFLEKHAGQDSFTPADINNLYYEAKLETSNTSQMIVQNIKRGFVMEKKGGDGGRKRYLLTSSGEQFIEKKRIQQTQ